MSSQFLLSDPIRRDRRPLPSGPKGLPLLGVALEHPKQEFWKAYARWGKEYDNNSGLISFHILGRRIIVINSRQMAETLLDNRGAIYSDRQTLPNDVRSYNDRLRDYRRLMHQDFNSRESTKYWQLQEHEAIVLLKSLLDTPENIFEHIRRFSGAVILKIAYGYEVKSEHDRLMALTKEGMRVASLAAAPGRWLVDSFPILRYIPRWFPGAGFKRKAERWGELLYSQSLIPHNFVKKEIAAGKASSSFSSKYLCPENGESVSAELEDLVLWTSGALFTGGSDTTVSVVQTFVLVMALNPDIQRLAQAEIDRVIGHDRLPKMTDCEDLPYVGAIIKETLRWGTVSPLGLPRSTAREDEVMGYKIPKGCVVFANIWAMLHDESVYPDPEKFNPSRFMGEKQLQQPDPRELAFGRGRRACPGQFIAEASVFIQVASLLATFDIRKGFDDDDIQSTKPHIIGFTTAIVSFMKPFKCKLVPRRKEIRTLIEDALAEII
ncbi:hypothetical protein Clacol_006595 [Clathrus columnatus]|uniref:Cytochrome P450 n=1 Tax=Clathrus columnatus TaxID=1419009 RepID=A0AAV5AI48_9AGAM|nr:hypothetical protein Clacol_006595 [Clathrus columnatus]